MATVGGLISIVLMPYLAAVTFYHSHPRRCPLPLPPLAHRGLRWLAWAVLLLSFCITAYLYGLAHGIFYQLFAAALLLLLSLLLATRWPTVHWGSGLLSIVLSALLIAL